MLGTEERERVLAAIDALPHKYRLPLVLRYFEDLDYAGIAELLRVSTNQVGTLLFRARRRLRADLAGGGGR
jgi:RNA polymerase sigma-70 factor (ECF subfamily)